MLNDGESALSKTDYQPVTWKMAIHVTPAVNKPKIKDGKIKDLKRNLKTNFIPAMVLPGYFNSHFPLFFFSLSHLAPVPLSYVIWHSFPYI